MLRKNRQSVRRIKMLHDFGRYNAVKNPFVHQQIVGIILRSKIIERNILIFFGCQTYPPLGRIPYPQLGSRLYLVQNTMPHFQNRYPRSAGQPVLSKGQEPLERHNCRIPVHRPSIHSLEHYSHSFTISTSWIAPSRLFLNLISSTFKSIMYSYIERMME